MAGQEVKASSTHLSSSRQQPRPRRSQPTDLQSSPAPAESPSALNPRLAAETRVRSKVLNGRGQRCRPTGGTHRRARGRTHGRTAPAVGAGPAYRGAEGPTSVREAASGRYIPRRSRAGGVPAGRGESGRPLPANSAGRPRPRPGRLRVCLSGLRASEPPRRPAQLPVGCPTFSAAPRRVLGAAAVSASSAPAGSERGGPGAHGARPPAPAPPPQGPSLRRPRLCPRCPPRRPPPCAQLPAPLRSPPAASAPDLPCGVSVGVSVAPPGLSPASSRLCPGSRPCASLSVSLPVSVLLRLSLPPTLGAAPAVSDPGPRPCRVPGSPGSPSSRRPRRAENSQLAARRPALRDFRPSSHVTRAPLRRPPPAPSGRRSSRRPAGPGSAPSSLPSLASHPSHPPAARGTGRGEGLHGPAPAPDPARVFLRPPGALLPEPIPRIRSRVFQAPRGRAAGVLRAWTGVGWRGSALDAGASGRFPQPGRPPPLLKYQQLRTLRTPLLAREGPC